MSATAGIRSATAHLHGITGYLWRDMMCMKRHDTAHYDTTLHDMTQHDTLHETSQKMR